MTEIQVRKGFWRTREGLRTYIGLLYNGIAYGVTDGRGTLCWRHNGSFRADGRESAEDLVAPWEPNSPEELIAAANAGMAAMEKLHERRDVEIQLTRIIGREKSERPGDWQPFHATDCGLGILRLRPRVTKSSLTQWAVVDKQGNVQVLARDKARAESMRSLTTDTVVRFTGEWEREVPE